MASTAVAAMTLGLASLRQASTVLLAYTGAHAMRTVRINLGEGTHWPLALALGLLAI